MRRLLVATVLLSAVLAACGDARDSVERAVRGTTTTATETTTTTSTTTTARARTDSFLVASAEADNGEGDLALERVDVGGGRTPLRRWPAEDPNRPRPESFEPSPDGRHAVALGAAGGDRTRVVVLALAGGSDASFEVPGVVVDLGFTAPTGENLVVSREAGATRTLERWSRNGTRLATLARSQAGTAPLTWLYAPDGRSVLVNDGKALRRVGIDGRPEATINTPGPDCVPVRWRSATEIVASCRSGDDEFRRLWAVPVDDVGSRALTPDDPGRAPVDFGYRDVVEVGRRSYVQWTGDCGAAQVRVLAGEAAPVALAVERSMGADHLVGLTTDGRLAVWSREECGGPGWFGFTSPDGSRSQVIVRDGVWDADPLG